MSEAPTRPWGSDLAAMTWVEVSERVAGTLLVVPLGSTEQHGPHLPLSVDTDIAVGLCEELGLRRADVLVAPAVPYGSSGEHAAFAGTLSIGQDALEHLLTELVRSADAFAGVMLVSAHGGNAPPLRRALATLRAEGRRVRAWAPPALDCGRGGDAHAGYSETSVMRALRPRAVRDDRMAAGRTEPLADLMGELVRSGVAAVSANGVLGDPRGSTSSAGAEIMALWADDLDRAVEGWP